MADFGPEAFRAATGVSRETLERLIRYADLLEKWQKAINLVGSGTLPDLWRRHFLDSAQLLSLAPPESVVWVDLGSGAGFPGLVLALLGASQMHLIESDTRKCVFLQEVARQTNTSVTIHRQRIETVPAFPADVVTARALAPISQLVQWSRRFASGTTVALFLKGPDIDRELTEVSRYGIINIERIPSRSDPAGIVLRVKGLSSA